MILKGHTNVTMFYSIDKKWMLEPTNERYWENWYSRFVFCKCDHAGYFCEYTNQGNFCINPTTIISNDGCWPSCSVKY